MAVIFLGAHTIASNLCPLGAYRWNVRALSAMRKFIDGRIIAFEL
jgi:hypothetical protein